MIQSHYVPLERPYRIIYAGGVVGLQIGTLIVVDDQMLMLSQNVGSARENRAAYWNCVGLNSFKGIKTYSHPVVSYINKTDKGNRILMSDAPYGGEYSEAVVWNQMDQRDVMTLCLEGEKLHWDELGDLLHQKVSACRDKNSAMEIMMSVSSLVEHIIALGGSLQLPQGNVIRTYLLKGFWEDDDDDSRELSFHTYDNASFPFVARTNDVEEAYQIMSIQKTFYERMMKKINPKLRYSFVFQNQIDKAIFPEIYDEVQSLVNGLNEE